MRALGWRGGLILCVIALCVIAWFAFPIRLGLDLRGGSYLVLEVETQDALAAECDTVAGRITAKLRDKGITAGAISRDGMDKVVVQGFPPDKEPDVRTAIDESQSGWIVSQPGPGQFTLQLPGAAATTLQKMAVDQCLERIQSRIDQFGVAEQNIAKQGGIGESALERIVLQLPGVEDPSRVKDIVQTQARLEWKEMTYPPGVSGTGFMAPPTKEALVAAFGGALPPDTEAYPQPPDARASAAGQTATRWWPLKKTPAVAGSDLRSARRGQDRYGKPAVDFELSPEAGRRFEVVTRENKDKIMAIVLDGKVVSAPLIKAVISSNGIIEGSFTREAADDLALKLRSGALPARVTIVEERTVGPSLGSDSIRAGVGAALVGFAAVMLFMLFYYRLSGLNAVVALAVNVVILLGAMSWMRATLTLPGIAGLILTVGMSVDSNVLIFERIREELGLGKSPRAAIDAGFKRVWTTIVDTHVTTLASAFFLFAYGTGPIRGFAVTLIIGLLASVFTAVFVSRFLYDFVLRSRTRQTSLSI